MGAKLGANIHRVPAASGHYQPLITQLSRFHSHTERYSASAQMCLLSSGSRVRILPGAPLFQAKCGFPVQRLVSCQSSTSPRLSLAWSLTVRLGSSCRSERYFAFCCDPLQLGSGSSDFLGSDQGLCRAGSQTGSQVDQEGSFWSIGAPPRTTAALRDLPDVIADAVTERGCLRCGLRPRLRPGPMGVLLAPWTGAVPRQTHHARQKPGKGG
jgi:hypothetical protein